MAGTTVAVADATPLMTATDTAMDYARRTGQLQADLDYVAAMAGAAAQVYDDPRDIETLRGRLREIAAYARTAANK